MSLEQLFIEQAEYLENDTFERWNAEHPDESQILKKLMLGGAKLISGPRGCGKTTLLLKALHKMRASADAAFPVYVNFKRSLSIEPLYKEGADGTYWFNQWILLKLYQGIYESLEYLDIKIDLSVSKEYAKKAAAFLEMANASKISGEALSVDVLELDILRASEKANRSRCVLLLDDAAHAFSPDQQRDFFDFFRQIKSQSISPKAAVYPGVTTYSSSFHVGHDAEQIDVWIKPDRDEYLEFMKRVIEARFPPEINQIINENKESVDFLSYAAFGVPRALLNMLQELTTDEGQGDSSISLSRQDVINATKQHYANTRRLFTSLHGKLPVYKNFIDTGERILINAINQIKSYNKAKEVDKQSVSIAIAQEDITPELKRVFSLFQYAGLCIPKEGLVSRGEKGRFQLYMLHYAGLIDSNALLGARSINLKNYVIAFSKRDAHEFTRTRSKVLLTGSSTDSAFLLSLPPCPVCKAPRLYEDARFCATCGSPLTSNSTYLDLINTGIGELPLTEKRITKILEQSRIRKIKDILMDHEHNELLGVDRIGPYWAEKIMRLAEEFVE